MTENNIDLIQVEKILPEFFYIFKFMEILYLKTHIFPFVLYYYSVKSFINFMKGID